MRLLALAPDDLAVLAQHDVVLCSSVVELERWVRVSFAGVVIDGRLPQIDRDLIHLAAAAGPVIVVGGPAARWRELGAWAVLPADATPAQLTELLWGTALPAPGRLVVVTGHGGAGATTTAIELATKLEGDVILADLAIHAHLALLHDRPPGEAGLLELVDAARTGRIGPRQVNALAVAAEGYRLLPGLRDPRDWLTLGLASVEAAIDALTRAADVVVADVEGEVDGERETGSIDIEERNGLARAAAGRADLLVVVARPTRTGRHELARILEDLARTGVPTERILPAVVGELDDLAATVERVLRGLAPRIAGSAQPVRVRPGELGHWADTTPRRPQQP